MPFPSVIVSFFDLYFAALTCEKMKGMKTVVLLLVIILTFANGAKAQENVSAPSVEVTETLQPLETASSSYLSGNWFVQADGGASAFVGEPLGCADLFGRTRPAVSVSFGKWFTPSWGAMAGTQGLSFKDCNLNRTGYLLWHGDLMYNLTGNINLAEDGQSRWDLVPYAGMGLVWNADAGNHPFALHYGLMVRRRLASRVHLNLDLSGMTTFGDFDGTGNSDRLNDNMLTLSCGLSVTIGRAGWRRSLPALTYMVGNGRMVSANITNDNSQGDNSIQSTGAYPRNDYSGLNSLRRRMQQEPLSVGESDVATVSEAGAASFERDMLWTSHPDSVADERVFMSSIVNGTFQTGAPVCFFFQLATDKLTDQSQQVNLDALAGYVRENNLKVRVTGLADSNTGTTAINDRLSRQRAEYIKQQLVERGVDESLIETRSEGGTDRYVPQEANRCAKVDILFQGMI